ncbi:hypothetical protein [Paenibacillus sp. NPDC058071]|uniref:hypothetical protein n=1 Tax=Paenibacillus sp. NPDC058071 TaxID=3346326 RepID=UPI0036D9A29B
MVAFLSQIPTADNYQTKESGFNGDRKNPLTRSAFSHFKSMIDFGFEPDFEPIKLAIDEWRMNVYYLIVMITINKRTVEYSLGCSF